MFKATPLYYLSNLMGYPCTEIQLQTVGRESQNKLEVNRFVTFVENYFK